MPTVGDTKVQCEFCSHFFVKGSGLTNHQRGCSLNPARRPQKKRVRKTCPKCRTLIDAGNFYRHVQVCKGRKDEEIFVTPPEQDSTRASTGDVPFVLTPVTLERGGPLPKETTSELLVELLFPNGVMPTHPEFVRAFRAWLDATDKLVAIAGMDS